MGLHFFYATGVEIVYFKISYIYIINMIGKQNKKLSKSEVKNRFMLRRNHYDEDEQT